MADAVNCLSDYLPTAFFLTLIVGETTCLVSGKESWYFPFQLLLPHGLDRVKQFSFRNGKLVGSSRINANMARMQEWKGGNGLRL